MGGLATVWSMHLTSRPSLGEGGSFPATFGGNCRDRTGQSLARLLVSPLGCVEDKRPEQISAWGCLGSDKALFKEEMHTDIGVV